MATLALSVAGSVVGSTLLPGGVDVFGATISGAVIGSQAGALAGSYVDQALFGTGGQSRNVHGPRLTDLKVTSSTEGAAIPRLFGRARLGGQLIWATEFEEVASTSGGNSGGKASLGAAQSGPAVTTYRYYANFAVALCEGVITSLGRVWADGRELDLSDVTWRLHAGSETQSADSLIVAREGSDAAPAYRGVAYIVFEHLDLAPFGNRIPQLSFEVHRAVDTFEALVRGVVMIPGSGEFVYATEPVQRRVGLASHVAENTNTHKGGTDWQVALDQLDEALPNARSTSLVVSWFGSDLRAAHCLIRPAVDSPHKITQPLTWSVAGLSRQFAPVVSQADDRAVYGGTPSDGTVIAAIRDLKSRGHKVTLTPFILMDVPSGNALSDPYTGAATQPAYPWRGRVTVDPAPGRPGSPDKSPAAALQLANFIGAAQPSHYTLSGETVVYSGPAEWSLRRMILHYAKLAAAAGGVDAFVIGSELRGLTTVRSGTSVYPFVAALVQLAADVKSILGAATNVTYAADWTEYFGHQPPDGSGDVYFHLDPLWASPAIDAVAIDCYFPLADWRDGDAHLDKLAGTRQPYDLAYLKANLFSGEGFDWYYASDADRGNQVRTPITDGSGKAWVFRSKDLKSWWQSPHHNRPGGIETATPTAWVPQSKPIWLTEIGCPAVDKGANQPNVFVDPKSIESHLPYFSSGERDDLMQRRYLQAILEAFDPAHAGYVPGANPVSTVTAKRMLDLGHVHIYAWDARPYPAFPANVNVWSDGENWKLGHWLNGRVAGQPLEAVVRSLLQSYGFASFDASRLYGVVAGLVVERVMSARDALSPLELAYFFDAVESGNAIVFRHRGAEPPVITLGADDLVETKPEATLLTLTRAQETELPAAARIAYSASETAYRQAVAASRRLVGASGRESSAELALVMDGWQASRIADTWLFEAWAARERASFALPPSRMAIEPADTIVLAHAGRTRQLRVTSVGDHGARDIEARSIDPSIYAGGAGISRPDGTVDILPVGPALALFLDLPLLTGNESPEAGYVAAAREPWPGGIAFYRSPDTTGFTLQAIATRSAVTGITLDPLPAGPEGRFDHAASISVRLDSGALASTSALSMLSGVNIAAIEGNNGEWEIIQFRSAELVGERTWKLATLLRGQAGSERAMLTTRPAGIRFVLLDEAITPLALSRDQIGLAFNWRYGPSNRDLGHPDYTAETRAFSGRGLRPLSPVHVRAGRAQNGDVALSWIRRTRQGGDTWLAAEVPLAEDSERYEVEILSATTVKRVIASSTPTAAYSAADQTTDFGSPQSAVALRVYQLSAFLGRGTPRDAVV